MALAAFDEKTVYHSSIGLHLYLKKLFGLLVGAISGCQVSTRMLYGSGLQLESFSSSSSNSDPYFHSVLRQDLAV